MQKNDHIEHAPEQYAQLMELAVQLAKQGGSLALDLLGKVSCSYKSDQSIVTEADYKVQQLIVSAITKRFAQHTFIVEEATDAPRPTEPLGYTWVIDPVDGTRNYWRGAGPFSTAIAVLHNGLPVAAAVYDPQSRYVFHAYLTGGAYRNGTRITVRQDPITDATMITSSAGKGRIMPGFVHRWLDDYVLRIMGSYALDLAIVASGAYDACLITPPGKLWDVAAGWLLVTEAGGMICPLERHGQYAEPILATQPDPKSPNKLSYWPLDTPSYNDQGLLLLAASPAVFGQLYQNTQE